MTSDEANIFLEIFNKLNNHIESKIETALKNQPQQTFTSEHTNLLADAMAVAQGMFLEPSFYKLNSFTKTEYADMSEIIRCTRKALSDSKIFFTQVQTQSENSALIITTRLEHQGQWIQSTSRIIPVQGNPKATDSAIQFAKRSAAMSLLGFASKNDYADDDGNAAYSAVENRFERGVAINEVYANEKEYATISKDQIAELDYELQGYPDLLKQIYTDLRVDSLADIPASRYRVTKNRIIEIKLLREGKITKDNHEK